MMKHKHIQKKMLRFLEGDLPEDEQQEIARHLQQCQACRNDIELLARLWQTEQPIERIPPPPFLWTRLQQRRKKEREKLAFPLRELVSPIVRPALVTIVLILALFFGQQLGQQVATSSMESDLSAVRTVESGDEFGMDYFEVMPPGAVDHTVLAWAANEKGIQQ